MAINWQEMYGTIIKSKTWEESIEGYKITNVFGLAWNYYVAYTKFITGLDMTLDFGYKIEMFYANCYKLGSAAEYKSNMIESAKMENSIFRVFNKAAKVSATETNTAESRTTVVTEDNTAVESRLVVVGDDYEERDELVAVTTGSESRSTSSLIWAADNVGFQVTATFAVNAPTLMLNGDVVEIG